MKKLTYEDVKNYIESFRYEEIDNIEEILIDELNL